MRIVARKSARQSTLVFKPGAKRKSLIEWNDPSRQAQILDWNQRARDFGLTVDEREETDEVEHDEMEPRRILEEDEPEAFREQAIRRRDDLDEPEEEEQPLAAGVSREDVDLVRVYLQHIGKRKLLKAHQEVEIGGRIEQAQRDLLGALADIPGAAQTLIALAD